MDDNSFYGAPAGWYPDPLGLPQLRWWDSTAWTHQTAEARAPMVMQETTYAWPEDEVSDDRRDQSASEEDLLTRRERRERERRDDNVPARPTALTLLQLEPPSRADVQQNMPEPEPFNPFGSQAGQTSKPAGYTDQGTDRPVTFQDQPTRDLPSRDYTQQEQQPASVPPLHFDGQSAPASYAQPTAPGTQGSAADAGDFAFAGYSTSQPSNQNPQAQQTFNWAPSIDPRTDPQYQAYLKAQTAPHTKATNNGAVWMIALIPLIQLVLSLLTITAIGTTAASGIMAVIWLAPYPITIGLAALDRHNLKKTGHEKTAHWLWSLLTAPIYLIARAIAAIRESGGGFGPVLVWFALGLLQIGAIFAVPGLIITTLPTLFVDQAQESITSDAAVNGAKLDVTCPAELPTIVGQSFYCDGQRKGVDKPYQIQVSLQRVNGWINWRVDDWGVYTMG